MRDLVDRCIALLRPTPAPLDAERIAYWPALPLTDSIGESSAVYFA